jgi:hypothetical protein
MATSIIYTIGSDAPCNEKAMNSTSGVCYCCGRKVGANPLYMHVNTSWELIARNDTTSDSQGCFEIGSTCANKFADGILFRNEA